MIGRLGWKWVYSVVYCSMDGWNAARWGMLDGFLGAVVLVVGLGMVGWLAQWNGIKSPWKSLSYRLQPFCRIAAFQCWSPSDKIFCSNTDGLTNEIDRYHESLNHCFHPAIHHCPGGCALRSVWHKTLSPTLTSCTLSPSNRLTTPAAPLPAWKSVWSAKMEDPTALTWIPYAVIPIVTKTTTALQESTKSAWSSLTPRLHPHPLMEYLARRTPATVLLPTAYAVMLTAISIMSALSASIQRVWNSMRIVWLSGSPMVAPTIALIPMFSVVMFIATRTRNVRMGSVRSV